MNFDSLDKVCDDCYNLYRDIDVYSACQMVGLLMLVSLNKNYEVVRNADKVLQKELNFV